ncbi:MAG: glyoxalase superfamily protein [Agitococcus sp.]|nr:glyoxalase superfamily protein [Agitococcus sp.]
MINVTTLKAQAKNLKIAMAAMGVTLTPAQSLEAIAKQYGYENWDTVAGVLNKEPAPRPPRLADMPSIPEYIWVEGLGPWAIKCDVAYYAATALALLHDEIALRAYLTKECVEHGDGLSSTAIQLQSTENREGLRLTFKQLLGISYINDGIGSWKLRNGLTYLRFVFKENGQPANPAEASRIAIPQMLKSTKGCSLVQLPSHDGSFYDKFVLVPPQLDAKAIAQKISFEIARLKKQDLDNITSVSYVGYTATDISTFVISLGCTFVAEPETTSENWD